MHAKDDDPSFIIRGVEGCSFSAVDTSLFDPARPGHSPLPSSSKLRPEGIVDHRAWRVFPASMEFEHFHHARDHAVCSASLLKVRAAMANMKSTAAPAAMSTMHSATTSCADSLCLGIPYFLKLGYGSYGLIMASGPLKVASSWYSRQAHESSRNAAKLQCRRQVEAYIRSRGTRTW